MAVSSLRVLVPASSPVLPLVAARAHVRVDHDADDDVLIECVATATEWVEMYLDRALITQTLVWSFGRFIPHTRGQSSLWQRDLEMPGQGLLGGRAYELPRAPAQAVTDITIVSYNGTSRSLAMDAAVVDLSLDPAQVTLGQGWPGAISGQFAGHIAITFRAGYGDRPAAVPAPIRMAIRWLTAFLYENRGDIPDMVLPEAVKNLIYPYRLISFAG